MKQSRRVRASKIASTTGIAMTLCLTLADNGVMLTEDGLLDGGYGVVSEHKTDHTVNSDVY